MERLSISLMGNFDVSDPNGVSLRPSGRKPAALLAYLGYHLGREIPRDRLANLFWSDRGQKQAQDSLRQALHAIKASMNGFADSHLSASRHSVILLDSAAHRDLWREDGSFNEELSENLLDDLDHVSSVFDDWLSVTRREVRQRQITRAERLLAQLEEDHDPSEALKLANTVLRLDPTNENAARKAMVIRASQNELGHVKRVFDDLREALQEIDLDVSARTLVVFEEVSQTPAEVPDAPAAVRLAPSTEGSTVDIPVIAIVGDHERSPINGMSDVAQEFLDRLVWRMTQMPEIKVRVRPEPSTVSDQSYQLSMTETVRIDAQYLHLQLVSASGEAVWSHRLKFTTVAHDEDLEATVDASLTQMLPVLEEHVYRTIDGPPTTAYANYILARRHYLVASDDNYMEQVLAYLHRSVELDPEFLPAIEKLVMHYNTGHFMTRPGAVHTEPRKVAYRYAQQMLFLNSKYPNAHVRMAWCLLWKGNHDSAERSLRKAMELMPYDPHVLNVTGTALVYLGYPDEAEAYYKMGQDRMIHDMDFQRTDYGELHYLNGEFAEALSWIETPEVRTPYRTYFWRIPTFAQLGMIDNAKADIAAMHRDLAARWTGPDAFTPEAGIQWMCSMKPYRRAQDRQLLIDGYRKAGITLTDQSFPLIAR